MYKKTRAFTLTEIAVVITIVAILVTASVFAYRGIQGRAAANVLRSDLQHAVDQLSVDEVRNGSFPISPEDSDRGKGLIKSPGTTYQYDSDGTEYCITATSDTKGVPAIYATSDTDIQSGVCEGHVDENAPPTSAGEYWVEYTPAQATHSYSGVAYGNGIYAAVADMGSSVNYAMSSSDGQTWTARATPHEPWTVGYWKDMTFGGGRFVAVASDVYSGSSGVSRAMYSTNGTVWTRSHGANSNTALLGVTYAKGRFVAVGTNKIISSTNGINWSAHTSPAPSTWRSVLYAGGRFVAVANVGDSRAMTSVDGENWSAHSTPAGGWVDLAYGRKMYVAVGSSKIMTSVDGENWTELSVPGSWPLSSIAYGKGRFVAAGSGIVTSTDGINWTEVVPSGVSARSVTFAQNCFTIVGGGGKVMRSCE